MRKQLSFLMLLALMVPWTSRAQSCTPISTFPVTYGFEASEGFTSTVTAAAACTTNVFGTCWRNESTSGTASTANRIWHIYGGTSTTYKHTGSNSLILPDKGSSSAVHTTMLVFPAMNFTSANGYVVSFWIQRNGTATNNNPEGIKVYASPTDTIGPNAVLLGHYSRHRTMAYPDIVPTTGWYQYETAPITLTGTVYLIFEGQSYYSSSTYIDDVVISEAPSCNRVTDLAAPDSLITSSSITLTWTDASNTSATYDIYRLTATDTTLVQSGVSGTTYTVTGLEGSTGYTFAVMANCGGGDYAALSTPVSAYTSCMMISSLPYQNGFEDDPAYSAVPYAEAFPLCWTRINDASGTFNYYPYLSTTSTYVHSGSVGMYWYHSTTNTYASNEYAVLPPVDLTVYDVSDLTLAFYAKTTSTSYHPQPIIGVMTDPTDTSTFVAVHTFSDTALTTNWQLFAISLASYTGNGAYIAIKWPRPSALQYMAIDDIFLTDSWCNAPTNLTAMTTSSELTLSWNANGSTSFIVYAGDDTVSNVTDSTYTFNSLDPNTLYNYGVMANCSGSASLTLEGSIRTLCEPLTSLPYENDFEGVTSFPSNADAFPSCWTRVNDASNTSYNYYPYLTTTASYVHSGSVGMYWYHTTTAGYANNEYAVLPQVDPTMYDVSDLTLAFYAKTTGATYHPQPIVGVMSNPADTSSFTPVYTFTATEVTTDWQLFVVPLSSYTGTGSYIAIKWPKPSVLQYLAIDDIYLTDSWCDAPENVAATSTPHEVTLTWSANGNTSFTVSVGEDTVYGVSGTTYTFTNLTPNTPYTYAVAAECSGSTSLYVGGSIRTECVALDSLPYTQTFEAAATGSASSQTFVDCMHRLNNGTTYFGWPYVSASASYNVTPDGGKGLYWFNSTTATTYGDYQVVVLPAVDTDYFAMNTLQLRFWARATAASYDVRFQVGVMTDPTDVSTFQLVQNVVVGGNTTYNEYIVTFGDFEGYGQYVAIKAVRPTTSWYATVDDITLEVMPNCPNIVDLTVAGTTPGSALLTWNYREGYDTPVGYELTYEAVGSDDPTTIYPTDPVAQLSELTAGTTYKVWVRSDCGSEQGAVDSIVFNTRSFNCVEVDATSLDTVEFTNSTSGISGCLAYASSGNTVYQTIYTAAELTAAGLTAGPITGIDLGFTASTYAKEFTIFMGNTSTTTIADANIEDPNNQMQVYGPAAHPTGTAGWQHYNFSTPFVWDGTSSIIITTFMNQPTGTSQTLSSGLNGYYVSATNRARYRYLASNQFTLSNYNGGTAGSIYSYRAAIHFYTAECTTEATCAAPALAVTDLSATSATLTWVPGYDETAWDVDYRIQGAAVWTNAATGVTNTTYTIDSLNAGTNYEFRVSFECDDDDNTLYAATATAFTPCLPVSLPYSENFDAVTTSTTANYGLLPNCWDYTMTGSSTYQASTYWPRVFYSTSTNYVRSGNYCLYLYGVGYYELPEMPTSVDSLMISFYDYTTSANYGLIVGAIEDGEFVPIDTAHLSASTSNFVELNLSSYTGTSHRLALRNYYTTAATTYFSYHYIDDIYVDYIPTCPHVENLAIDSVTENSVTLSWTAGGTEDLWSVSDGHGFYTTTIVPSVTITGLTANTPYTYEVRALCDATDSSRAMSILARTACEPYMTLPYFDDFEGYTTSISAATGAQPSCWDWLMTGTSTYQGASYQPQLYYSSTTGTYSHSGNYSLRLYGVSYTTLQQLPVDANMVSMGFWTRSTSASYLLYVGVMTDPTDATTFDTIQQITNTGTSVPEYHEIDFSNYTGTGRYIAFRNVYTTASTYYSYHYIDDIEVWQNSSCATPTSLTMTNITDNSATLGWVDTSNSYNGANIFWGTSPNRSAVTDSATVSGSVSYYTLTGLSGSTTYYVWIQGECTIEPSRAMMTSFTTTPDCMPVEDLTVASIGNHAFSLSWNAPSTGNAPTGYIVSWNQTGYDSVHVDTVTNTYYYAGNLEEATNYTYSVSTLCGNLVVEGEPNYLTTTLCTEETTGEYATNFSALPVRAASPYSYTQQIYLAEELGGIDSISAVAFYNDGYAYNRRNVTVYLGNTSKSEFASATDFIPLSSLTQVYSGPYEGFNWFTMHFTQTFVRDVDSNLVLVVDDNTGTAWSANTAYFASSNLVDTMRAIYSSNTADINPANPTTGTSYLSQYRNHVIFTPADCEMSDCDIPVPMATASTENSITIQWETQTGTSYTVEYRMVNTTAWTSFETSNTTGTCVVNTLTPSETWEIRVGYSCEGGMVYGTISAVTLCGNAALPIAEDFESNGYGDYVRPCWVVGQTRFNGTDVYPRVTRLTGSEDMLIFLYHGAYLIMPRVNAPLNELQLNFKLTQGGTGARLLLGVIPDQTTPITSMIVLDTLVRSDIDPNTSTVNIAYSLENIDTAYNNYHLAFYDAFSDNYSFLNDIVLDYIPSCTPPTVSLDTVTTTTATISWNTDGENATGYYVVYGPRGFVPGGEGSDTLAPATTPATITGLDHSTNYDAYVFTVCSLIGANSAASQVVQFTTECAPVTTLPYTMDFDHVMPAGNTSADMMPNCWLSESFSGTGRPRTYYTTESGYTASGNYCLYFSELGVAALPEMSAQLNTLAISFREYCTTPASQGLIVGTVSTAADGFSSTFVPYDTLRYDLNTNIYNRTVYFSDYTGTANRIAFKNVTTGGTSSVHYIDNVVVDVQPSCITPQNLHTTNLTGTEAGLAWNRSNSSSYTIIYGVHDSTATVTEVTSGHSIQLMGLTPQTEYDVKLVGDCSTDTVFFSFTTPCAAVTLPYTENFDGIRTTTTNGTADYGVVPSCWSYIMTGTASYQTGSYLPKVYYSTTYSNSGNYCLNLYGQSYTMLPPVPTSLDSLQITFNTYTTSANYALVVGAMEGNIFVPVDTISYPASTHQEVIVKFDTYHGTSRIIAFRNYYTVNTTTYYSYHYIDDIEVDYIPTCPKIANLQYTDVTDNSVTLSWNTTGTESEWVVSYGNTSTVVYDSIPTITGLQPDSVYTFAVRPLCDVADTGRARYITVRTACNPVTLPYQENFDGIRSTTTNGAEDYGIIPSCWNYIMTGTATYQTGSYLPKVYYSASYSHSGSYCLYLYGESYTILPPMPTSLDSLELTFWDYTTSTNYLLEVGVMEGTTFVPVQAISTPASTHMEQTVYFGTYTGTSRTIAFRNHNTTATTYYSYRYIDDIDVHYLPSCPRVLDVHASAASTTSISVDWIDQVPTTQWQMQYARTGHLADSATTVTVTSHPYNVTGLNELTNYDFRVRPICSATDTGDWSLVSTLMTAMCDNAVEVFTGTATGTNNQGPVNNYYRYTLSQTIIDSAELVGVGEISHLAYSYHYTSATTKKTNVNIWLQPTTLTQFAGTDAVAVNPATAVKVYHGSLNCSQGWNFFALDTTYVWDGHSNLLVIVQDNSGDYDGSTYTFDITSTADYKYLVYYVDGTDTISAYNPSSFTGTNKFRYQRRPTMKLISCNAANCDEPLVLDIDTAETAITFNWTGTASNYEVAIVEGSTWVAPASGTVVLDTFYTFTGLTDQTDYVIAVRAVCSANNTSEWVYMPVTTPRHPCAVPTAVAVSNESYNGATVSWTVGEDENDWEVRVFCASPLYDTTYSVTDTPSLDVTGLNAGVTYSVAVRAVCASDWKSPWSDTVDLTTVTCQPVTGVNHSNLAAHSVTITWTATGAESYEIEYGGVGFIAGDGTT
ncbi:MAG: fibronectin type III domain-containing protein, partial [Bacteroidales bacterium]|nr:fibronectin type III domain-containing protein [Bacteroidales bacterium]